MVSRLGLFVVVSPTDLIGAAKATGLIVLHVRLPLSLSFQNLMRLPSILSAVCVCVRVVACCTLCPCWCRWSTMRQIWLAIDTSAEMLEMLDCLPYFLVRKAPLIIDTRGFATPEEASSVGLI